jgi:hypothetical protein
MRAAMIRSGLYLELKHSAISRQWCSFQIARDSPGTPECGSRTVDSRLGDLARSQNSSRLHRRFSGLILEGLSSKLALGSIGADQSEN